MGAAMVPSSKRDEGSAVTLTHQQMDRAIGVMVASAAGDALGAGYEFRDGLLAPDEPPAMIGGGLGDFAPGEWTDDTTMAWCILDVAARGLDLRSAEALDAVAQNFADWFETRPKDIGVQTCGVLGQGGPTPTAEVLTAISAQLHRTTGRTAGNGALMRTGAVVFPYLGDEEALVEAVAKVSRLTHGDPLNEEACILWCCAIRHAVLTGDVDVRTGLVRLPDADRRARWEVWILQAETSDPMCFHENGFVVTALQAAWSAVVHSDGIVAGLDAAIRIGHDTDTVACIAGQLLGAKWGASAVPADWRRLLHGYPGIDAAQLAELVRLAVRDERVSMEG